MLRNYLAHRHLRSQLERIAELSPHLLADLGFVKDTASVDPDLTVWRKGEISIHLCLATGRCCVTFGTRITSLDQT